MDVFKGDPVAVNIGDVVFYGNVTGSHMHEGTKIITGKVWNIKYDLGDEEEVNTMQLMTRQKLYIVKSTSTILKLIQNHRHNQYFLPQAKKKNTTKK